MKKIQCIALALIALGVLMIVVVTVFFHPYTYAEDGTIMEGYKNETMMYLGTMQSIVGTAGALSVLGIILVLISRAKTLKKQDILAILFIALGMFTIIGSLTAFYPCVSVMKMNNRPMPCYWTMRVLIGIVGAIGVMGEVMLLFSRMKDIFTGLSIALMVLSGLLLLIPTKLSGICLANTMMCVQKFSPFAVVMSAVIFTMAVLNVLLLKPGRMADEDE